MSGKENSPMNANKKHSKEAPLPEKKETSTATKDSEQMTQSSEGSTKTSVDDEYVRRILREYIEKAKKSAELSEAKSQSEDNNNVKVSSTVNTGSLLDEQASTEESLSASHSYKDSTEQ